MDFDHATDLDRARAKMRAEQAGWRQCGFRYTHPERGSYLVKDMDGWIDLCDNEGIDWTQPTTYDEAVRRSLRSATHYAKKAARPNAKMTPN